MRDFVAIEDVRKAEEEVINVGPIHYDSAEGQSPADVLPRLLLKQPDVFVVPDLVDAKTVGILCGQVNEHHKMVVTRVVAGDAIEALLRVAALKAPLQEFSQAVSMVLAIRLVRKLCEACRQPYQPTPQMLQKLGIPPGRVGVLYREFQPPPPEQRVDAKGRPIEIEICKKCGGVGYLGRTGDLRNARGQRPAARRVAQATDAGQPAPRGAGQWPSRPAGGGNSARRAGHHFVAGTAARLEVLRTPDNTPAVDGKPAARTKERELS